MLTVVQIIGGLVSGSLALIADALHNFSDAGSLAIALIARRWSLKPADQRRTFGYRRAELIGAMINLTTLILIGLYLIFEAIMRFYQPQPIQGWIIIVIACVALIIDVLTAMLTYSMARTSLNIRAAFLHNMADAFGSVAVIIAGTVIIVYGWYEIDILCTLLIAGYVLYQGYSEILTVIRILMQSVPSDVEINNIIDQLQNIRYVKQIHHVHVWEIDEQLRSFEAHVVIDKMDFEDVASVKQQIKDCLKEKFNILHSTIEFESENTADKCLGSSGINNNCFN